ncbi:MAG: sn-glycerol-1-phosphate dehydrogenase [Defluviitaleaceae bacterium]|nr:sn-glycerol-1-phosphate dehydrogenase [Defluviitaleaceae bacterium]MCL2274474.1 sn-glycerol-1-phosphate dehydrogenase [Defluviitaleaceae bacterium]
MDVAKIIADLANCPCGREHTAPPMRVEIGEGFLAKTAELLYDFPRNVLVVADKNTLNAAEGILDVLKSGGFECTVKCYENMRTADIKEVEEIEVLAQGCDGVLSVGTGSLNDICRLASFNAGKKFAIFATAPSMDGFAANAAPITFNNFKKSVLCHAPMVIIGDTRILAAAPVELKAAGFGDMIAKYIAMADWRIAHLTDGEYYCPRVAALTKAGLEKIMHVAGDVQNNNPQAAAVIMEGLVLSGLAMTLTNLTRPASGAEHVVAHFWEIKKLEKGLPSDFHGKKVGVATILIASMYHLLTKRQNMTFTQEVVDWDEVYSVYGVNFAEDVKKMNNPAPTAKMDPATLTRQWKEIRQIVHEEIPPLGELIELMQKVGATTNIEDIDISPVENDTALRYHAFMRERINLTRLIPMMGELRPWVLLTGNEEM